MLKKIDIKDFGSFQDYRWCNLLNDEQYFFSKNNIIFGENYSGKTTLSRIIASLKTKEIHEDYEKKGKFIIYLKNGSQINQTNLSDSNYHVSIYNSDFIKENLKWFMMDDQGLESFAIIGEKNIDIERDISRCNNKLKKENRTYSKVENNFLVSRSDYKNYKKMIDNLLTDRARDIRNHPNLYGTSNYKRPELVKELDSLLTGDYKPLDNETIEKYKEIIKQEISKSNEYEKIEVPEIDKLILIDKINDLLTKEINVTNTVQKWVNDTQLSKWIEDAYRIHKDKYDNCQFCGGKLEEKVFQRIEEHFSKETEDLKVAIDIQISNLNNAKETINNFSLNENQFLSNLKDEIVEFNSYYLEIKAEVDAKIREILTLLNQRIENPLKVLEPIKFELNITEQTKILNKKLNKIIDKNKEEIKNLNDTQEKLKSKLRLNKVYSIFTNFLEDDMGNFETYEQVINKKKQLRKIMEWRERVYDNKNRRIDKIKSRISELETQLKQEQATADQINKYMSYFFQDRELELKLVDNEKNSYFKVYRNSKEAKNLSEGERRIISFCYYLTTIHDNLQDESSNDNLIIFIDDPISSLDIKHIFTMFSIIDTFIVRNGSYNQLFISTHNLEFLKYLNQLKSEDITHYQIIKKRREKDGDYKSYITRMQPHLKENATEFHYLFREMKRFREDLNDSPDEQFIGKIENTYTTFYSLPNIIRRFLEIYLFYRYPNTDSFYTRILKFVSSETEAILIYRIINEYSHSRMLERGKKPIEIYELKKCLNIIFERMEYLDTSQYEELIKI